MTQTTPDAGLIGSWSPGIGDPTVIGWITAVAYLATAYLCFRVYRRLGRNRSDVSALTPLLWALLAQRRRLMMVSEQARISALWLGLAVGLLLLGINKQLDLQTALTEIGRMLARAGGWYEQRRKVQVAFIAGVVALGLWGVGALWVLIRGRERQMWPALLGAIFLACFVSVRAASFHHVDIVLGSYIGGVRVNWAVELGGIAFVAVGALCARRETAFRPSAL